MNNHFGLYSFDLTFLNCKRQEHEFHSYSAETKWDYRVFTQWITYTGVRFLVGSEGLNALEPMSNTPERSLLVLVCMSVRPKSTKKSPVLSTLNHWVQGPISHTANLGKSFMDLHILDSRTNTRRPILRQPERSLSPGSNSAPLKLLLNGFSKKQLAPQIVDAKTYCTIFIDDGWTSPHLLCEYFGGKPNIQT